MCDKVMNVVLLLMKLTGMIGLAPWSARRQPQTTHAGLLGMTPCARGRTRELCNAACGATKAVIRVWRDDYIARVYPSCLTILQRETHPFAHGQTIRTRGATIGEPQICLQRLWRGETCVQR